MAWLRYLRVLIIVLGWTAGVVGVAYAVNGATQAPATVRVPVTLAAAAEGVGPIQAHVDGVSVPDGWLTGTPPSGARVYVAGQPVADSELRLAAWGSTRVEQLLARGDWLVGGLGLLVGARAIDPLLGSIAEGRPFAPGNARRLVVLAGTVAVAGVLAPLLPQIAGFLVLDRTGLAGPAFMATPSVEPAPLLVGALVLAVAAAFRAGERMADDVRGLV